MNILPIGELKVLLISGTLAGKTPTIQP